jgi:hypothetical protein
MNSIPKYHLTKIGKLETLANSQPQVKVLRLSEYRTISTSRSESLSADENGGLLQRTAMKEAGLNLSIPKRMAHDQHGHTGRVNPFECTAEDANFQMFLHKLNLPHQTVFDSDVVGVHDGNVLALREKTSSIAGLSQTAMWYRVELDSTVLRCVARSNRCRLVGGAEIDNDKLKLAEALAEDALDRLGEEAIDIAYHHGNRN